MAKKRRLNVIKRRLGSFDKLTSMQRCVVCHKATMSSTGRCAECRRAIESVIEKIKAQPQPQPHTLTVEAVVEATI